MHKKLAVIALFLLSVSPIFSQTSEEEVEQTIDQTINSYFEPVTDLIERIIFVSFEFNVGTRPDGSDILVNLPAVVVWLIVAAIFFTIYFKSVNFRHFGTAINIVRGKYDDPNNKGEVSHFQALTAALSGTVGLGNISGVAVAIALGGPGATFWMIVAGLLGMSSKFVECTLGVKYRNVDDKTGKVYGGPMYYLEKGFKEISLVVEGKKKNYGGFGKVLAVLFAIACIGGSFGGGNMYQANQAFEQVSHIDYMESNNILQEGWLFGIIMAGLVGVVIIGGIKGIVKVTDKIVPFMCGAYVITCIVIIFQYGDQVGNAITQILSGAFNPGAAMGGLLGVLVQGFQRSAFSNEAGVGSASIAHSAVKTNSPASEGLVALLEPFIDTVIVCTMTAIVIVITGNHINTDLNGVQLTTKAFGEAISWFPYVLTGAIVLFAFSTMISWSYYGLQAWVYLFGQGVKSETIYKIIFCLFIVVGSASKMDAVLGFSDAMIFLMCFPNIIGMYFLAPVVNNELKKYLSKIRSLTT